MLFVKRRVPRISRCESLTRKILLILWDKARKQRRTYDERIYWKENLELYDFGRADHYDIPDRVRCGTRDVAVRTDFPAVERLIFLR